MKVLAVFVLVLLLFSITPVNAAGEINPSVETIPFFCRYSLTDWTPLCPQASTRIIQGEMNQTPNMTPNMTSGADFTDSQYLYYGLSAQDLEGSNLEECVHTHDVTGIKTVDDRCVIAFLINVLKRQTDEIDELNDRVDSLEDRVEILEG